MGVGISFIVPVTGAMLRDKLFECEEDIVLNVRVGVFVYGDGGGGVGTKDNDVTAGDAGLTHKGTNLAGDVNHLIAGLGAYADFFVDYIHRHSFLHLLDDFDAEELGEAVTNGSGGQVAEQQAGGAFVGGGVEDGTIGIKCTELLSDVIKMGGQIIWAAIG
jgi:hypothetical protein